MIVLSPALVVSPPAGFAAHLPVIGWKSYVTFSNIVADHEDADHPATELANNSTNLYWLSSSTAVQYLTVSLGTEEAINYLALARHNFGTGGIIVSVEGLTAEPGADWEELCPESLPGDDTALLFRFADAYLIGIRLKLQPGAVAPSAAILYVGSLLVMEWGVAVGHTPLPYGRQRNIITGRSESGEYLGRIESGGALKSTAIINNLSPAFYRDEVDPFAEASPPFFFAWAPEAYPEEVGFAWLVSDLVPVPSHLAGYINITLDMEGLAL